MDVHHDDMFSPGRGLAKKTSATLPQRKVSEDGAAAHRAQMSSSSDSLPSIKRTAHGGQRPSARSILSLPETPPGEPKSVFRRASLGTVAQVKSVGDSLEARIDCVMGGKPMSAVLRNDHIECVMKELAKGPWMVSARKTTKEGRLVRVCSGPITRDTEESQLLTRLDGQIIEELAARSISTYPMRPCGKVRDGSPVCDGYLARLRGSTAILCLTDGCGWGARSREASIKAKCGFVEYLDSHIDQCVKGPDIATTLLRALAAAHCKIIEGKDESSNVGTTTLLGGYVVPLKSAEAFLFLFVSVGDCKAYLRKGATGKITDLTCDSRSQNRDAKDPGGRIGAYEADRSPDLRNLSLNSCICERGDMLILVTDGVSDNLDPTLLGATVFDPMANKLQWSCQKIEALLSNAAPKHFLRPVAVVNTLLSHCVTVTQASRDWHESGHLARVPEDSTKFPGKMDHSTCMCLMLHE